MIRILLLIIALSSISFDVFGQVNVDSLFNLAIEHANDQEYGTALAEHSRQA